MPNLDSSQHIWSLAWTAASIAANIIAIIAIVRADREVSKAIRAIDKVSSSRASRRADADVSNRDRSAFTHASASSFAGVGPGPNLPVAISASTPSGPSDSYSLLVSSFMSAAEVKPGVVETPNVQGKRLAPAGRLWPRMK